MIERGDHVVFDEPFSARYYFSPERRSDRFDTELPDSTGEAIVARLLDAAERSPVFVKEMAYQASGLLTEALLGELVNTFLVREPRAALASFARKWPDLTEEEAGYGRLGEAWDVAGRVAGAAPPVLDADDLVTDPAGRVGAWCSAVGIPFDPEALAWEPGIVAEWGLWSDWYDGVARSTGFRADPPGDVPPLDDRLEQIAARARPVYDRIAAARL